jgi:citrate/tricarballylate utilization protein
VLDENLLAEANRQFTICNACRYCEGICTVFPAMELRTAFSKGDVAYLSTLCHDCGACLPACPFTPPHDYAVDIPSLMQLARTQTFEEYARPRRLWRALTRASSVGGLMVATAAFFAIVAAATGDPRRLLETHDGPRSFYAVIEYLWLVIPAGVASALVLAAILAGATAFARETRGGARRLLDARAAGRAAADALALVNLMGGGGECHYPGDRPSALRRRLHHLVFYGFGLMFASTCSAAVEQELLGIQPPYGLLSVPVVLGSLGGVGTTAGCLGFLVLGVRARRNGRKRSESRRLDRLFTMTLLLSTVTGFLVLGLRATPLLGPALILHLGILGGLYLTFPYSKFVHWVYRYVALVRSHVELDPAAEPVPHEQSRPAVQPEPVAHGDG